MIKETPLTLNGQKTPKVVIYKSESHKLHQAFPVKSSTKIYKGQPVALAADGTIEAYSGTGVYVGIAVTDSINPAYKEQRNFPVEVTVMVSGFAIVNWVASAEISAGYVIPAATLQDERWVKCSAVDKEGDTSNFIALAAADEGDIVPVLVK